MANRMKLPPKLLELAMNQAVFMDPEGHFKLELPKGLTASVASAQGWRKVAPTRKQRADVERRRLRRALADDARADLAAAVGAPLYPLASALGGRAPQDMQRNRKARRDFNGRAGR